MFFDFIHPALLWGLGLVALPIAIHLINLLRHRRVEWAAMEFLLESVRKNSTWIRAKELLLLLLRVAAVAAVVLLVARPQWKSALARLLGGGTTHHVILLDDGYSMTERAGESSPWERGIACIQRLGSQLARESSLQEITLVRFSSAAPEMLRQRVDNRFEERLSTWAAAAGPTELAPRPNAVLAAAERLLAEESDDHRQIYIVSDFRSRDWSEPQDLVDALSRLGGTSEGLHLVGCAADGEHANLGIVGLALAPGTHASGIPLTMEVALQNLGPEAVEQVSVLLEEDGAARSAVLFDTVASGQTESRRFPVFFPVAGAHQVTARLAADSVAADNSRYALADVPLAVSALIIDGDPESPGGRFLAAALAPGKAAPTGISPRLEPPTFLEREDLSGFSTIWLVNVERLQPTAVTALEEFVHAGGGLAIYVGDRVQAEAYNAGLYKDGQGLLPAPLVARTTMYVDRQSRAADIELDDHPLFARFRAERNSFLSLVTVDRFFSVEKNWSPAPHSATKVIARLRNGAPLIIERASGAGRVLAILTTAGPQWNTWCRNPSFVLFALEAQAYLSRRDTHQEERQVGYPLAVELDPAVYQPQLKLMVPVQAAGASGGSTAVGRDAALRSNRLEAVFTETTTSGFYTLESARTSGETERTAFAYNVDAEEGDLAVVGPAELARVLGDVKHSYHAAGSFQPSPRDLAGSAAGDFVLYLLVGLLVGEQALAYAASYHPAGKEAHV